MKIKTAAMIAIMTKIVKVFIRMTMTVVAVRL